jgi:hypothetical protein
MRGGVLSKKERSIGSRAKVKFSIRAITSISPSKSNIRNIPPKDFHAL